MPRTIALSLVPHETDAGRGFILERHDGQRLDWDHLEVDDPYLVSFIVEGTSDVPELLNLPAFSPGQVLSLVPEGEGPDDPVGVWDREGRHRVGCVPADHKRFVHAMHFDCTVVWEELDGGVRTGLRVLAHTGDRIKGHTAPLSPPTTHEAEAAGAPDLAGSPATAEVAAHSVPEPGRSRSPSWLLALVLVLVLVLTAGAFLYLG